MNEIRDRLNEFTENYMEKLFYFCLKKTGNYVEAEDLTQDIALQVITALNKGTVPTNFSAWVWQIARNRYSVWAKEKHKRNEAETADCFEDHEVADDENIPEEMIHKEQLALLRRELAFIKSDYRNIVVGYYIENKSVREIASSLSIPVNTVKSRLLRGRQILKEGMDMAREFGKRSYKPEEIVYSNICTVPGDLGQPWTLMDPKLNQNIFLACYDDPMTAENLAIEVGVALPYIEDTVAHLTEQTLLIKKSGKYETSFPIISREAQRKIHLYYEQVMPLLVSLITESIDNSMAFYNEAGLCYYGSYQSYEEAKWFMLPELFKAEYSLSPSSPKTELGNTKRTNGGIWDVIAFERCDLIPDSVGFHCQTNGFVHYRFGYAGIQNRTPANLSADETHELYLMVKNKSPRNTAIAEKLVEYGYAYKNEGKFIPRVSVISKHIHDSFLKFCKKKNHSSKFISLQERQKEIHGTITKAFDDINNTVRNILNEDLPACIRENTTFVDALLKSVCTTSHTLGYVVKHAIESGWLKYDESTSPAIGAYFNFM